MAPSVSADTRFAELTDNPKPKSVETRLALVEHELSRLSSGWNQHIPQILDAVSIAQSELLTAEQVHERIDAVRDDLDRLSRRLDANLVELKAALTQASAQTTDTR